MRRYEISDYDWLRLSPLLLGKSSDVRRTARENRQFINTVLWVARSGAPGVTFPSATIPGTRFTSASGDGPAKALGNRFSKPCRVGPRLAPA